MIITLDSRFWEVLACAREWKQCIMSWVLTCSFSLSFIFRNSLSIPKPTNSFAKTAVRVARYGVSHPLPDLRISTFNSTKSVSRSRSSGTDTLIPFCITSRCSRICILPMVMLPPELPCACLANPHYSKHAQHWSASLIPIVQVRAIFVYRLVCLCHTSVKETIWLRNDSIPWLLH